MRSEIEEEKVTSSLLLLQEFFSRSKNVLLSSTLIGEFPILWLIDVEGSVALRFAEEII